MNTVMIAPSGGQEVEVLAKAKRRRFALDTNNPWWRMQMDLLTRAHEAGRGRWITGIPDTHSGGDALSALRGRQQLCIDLVDNAAHVQAAMEELEPVVIDVYNTPPALNNNEYSVHHSDVLVIDASAQGFLVDDYDADGDDLTVVIVSGPTNGTLDSINTTDGTFTYNPNDDFVGTDLLTYKVSDGCDERTGYVTINVWNNAPTANPDTYSMNHTEMRLTVSESNGVGANDLDWDEDDLTFALVSGPSHGALETFSTSSGSFIYNPDDDFAGIDSFTYSVSDGTSITASASVQIRVDNMS
ncbi:hypothetical protein LCGC14_2307470, partial [marine sediment metagenome]